MDSCELELRIQWLDRGVYFLDAKFVDLADDQESQILDPVRITIDLDRLRGLTLDPDSYGVALTQMVFGDQGEPINQAFQRAKAAASGRALRIRLGIQTSAPELHDVCWETLKAPGTDRPLLTQPGIWFSRFLSADNFRLPSTRDRDMLQALVVIANPADIQTRWNRSVLQPDEEYDKAAGAIREANRGIHRIVVRRLTKRATIYNIIADLRENVADVVYLACHGTLTEDGQPRLLLENDLGSGEMVRGEQLVERLTGINDRPRLVILASCRSAGGPTGRALCAVGPRLAQAGIPSVIAMQGDIAVRSIDRFMPRLFRELAKDGQIDRAMAEARGDIREEPDWWMPTLFTRSSTGCLWPQRITAGEGFDLWESVITDLAQGRSVPVLGPGLVEPLLGSTREMARQWAERYEFPLAPRDRDDFAQVAQYLTYTLKKPKVLEELREYVARHIRHRFKDILPEDLLVGEAEEGLVDKLVSFVGASQRRNTECDVHKLLAKLPAKIYVSANRDNLLRDALIEAGREPRVQLCTWRTRHGLPVREETLELPDIPETYEPSIAKPLIFHVFGNLKYPDSLVLTEDDYFEFLTAVTRNEALQTMGVPLNVSRAVANSGLLLLGFQVDDWDFRVLLSSILKQPGATMSDDRTRVAIQMNPDEVRTINPGRAHRYLRRYFERHKQVDVFWGSSEDFMRELTQRWRQRARAPIPA